MTNSELLELSSKDYSSDEMREFVDSLTQTDLAYLWRFAPVGSRFWQNNDYAVERFAKLGGFTPEISKKIGW